MFMFFYFSDCNSIEKYLKVDWGDFGEISVAYFTGSVLNSNFHWYAHALITFRSWFKSFAVKLGSFIENNMVSSAKT